MSDQPATTDAIEHDLLWSDRLQDWLDGDASDAATNAHLTGCELCQAQLAAFEHLDAALQVTAPSIVLDAGFDARLLTQIDALDDSGRAAARQRLEQELRDNVQALSRHWRQSVAFMAPGIIAGVALAFALVGWFDTLVVTQQLASEGTQEFGRQSGAFIQMLATAIIGAGIGAGVAGWLASTAD